jgi:membrane-associated phospholipid phosphatase
MHIKTALRAAAVAAVTLTHIAPAQSVGHMLVDDFKNAGGDAIAIWTSPFGASPRDWLLAGASIGLFGVSTFADRSVADWAVSNDSSRFFRAIGPLRHGGAAYTGKTVLPPIAAAYVVGLALKNQDLRDAVMGCMSSWLSQSAIRKGTYMLIGRERPAITDDPHRWTVPGDWEDWDRHSFPAGHFANAMSCATFWNTRFDLGYGGAALYALAGAVGVGRLADGGHWTSDTVLGGILGYAVGREVARRSLDRKETKKRDRRSVGLIFGPEASGTLVGLRVNF